MGGEAAILEPATSGGGMESMRDLSSALWSLRTNQEAARLLRTSLSLLRCFLFFDICYLIGGITLISMALSNQMEDRDNRMVLAGGLLTLFGSLSAMCNSLASHGVRTGGEASCSPGSSSSSWSWHSFSCTSPRCFTDTTST